MLPVIVFVAVAIPLLLLAFVAITRRRAASEGPASENPAEVAATADEYEAEFADAEAYQEKWREEEHRQHPDDRLY